MMLNNVLEAGKKREWIGQGKGRKPYVCVSPFYSEWNLQIRWIIESLTTQMEVPGGGASLKKAFFLL